ncbi:MAG TPA: sigma-70 family RNA polymerase sigma factor [Flavilitoribacter sp.]|nr:sigma-70 family RNA polymerase sigma factor [Flavilitoribacter sp.]
MTEQDIITGCQEGVPRCQRELVDRYAPMLLTVARRYARDQATAQDILQDALLRIFQAIPRYQPFGSFEAWMRRIVATSALQYLNKKWMRKEFNNLDNNDEPLEMPDIYGRLGAEDLLELIARLPEGYRQVFNLSVMEQYTHAEIAGMLGISESSSRSQLVRARRQLQTMIANREKIRI